LKEALGIRATEGTDHIPMVYCFPLDVKQYNKRPRCAFAFHPRLPAGGMTPKTSDAR
jgi:hypothetical protein